VFEQTSLPDGLTNVGRIQAFDGPIYLADAALYLKTSRPDLGIKDPYELNDAQYRAALDLLRQQHRMIVRYWHDPRGQVDDFESESVVASSSWPYQISQLKSKGAAVASTIPDEGATGWSDSTMMQINAPHPVCAETWIAHSLDPKTQGDVAAWFGSVPAVPAACKDNELLGERGCERNGSDDFEKIHFWRTPTAKCATHGECVPYHRWVSDFIAILGGR
jgi:putative spermidine/putrescine transport system substrate-binding protein